MFAMHSTQALDDPKSWCQGNTKHQHATSDTQKENMKVGSDFLPLAYQTHLHYMGLIRT